MADANFESWGRLERKTRHHVTMERFSFTETTETPILPFGNGRSYGDSCHNDQGTLIDQRARAEILDFDEKSGVLRAKAGVLLADILDRVIPAGYFLPVSPGTRFVTLGGAIANDVHGKNHHKRGTFGAHVERFSLTRSDKETIACSSGENADLYAATIGGLGVTGIINEAAIQLMKVPSPDICQHVIKFRHLDDYFNRIEAVDLAHEYSVAWVDQLAKGDTFGRGVLMAGDHTQQQTTIKKGVAKSRLSIPFQPPFSVLNGITLKAFNALYYARAKEGERIVPWTSYFYPLDSISHWNRLYGPRGLFQHQSVYPLENAPDTTAKLIECAQAHGHASFLTVLKRFGKVTSPGLMPFAREGVTLTLDFANRGVATRRMLDALDEIVMKAGGAINPYKDARMSPETFAASFSNWQKLEAMRDPAIVSDFWQRTAKSLPFSGM